MRSVSDDGGPWVSEFASLLADMRFPACQDELIATLIRRHAPSRLLRHLADLDRSRLYTSALEVVMACGGEHGVRWQPEVQREAFLPSRGRP